MSNEVKTDVEESTNEAPKRKRGKNKEKVAIEDPNCILTEEQAGPLIGFSPNTLRNWRHNGKGPKFIKYESGTIRYRRSDLTEWLNAQSTVQQNTRGERAG